MKLINDAPVPEQAAASAHGAAEAGAAEAGAAEAGAAEAGAADAALPSWVAALQTGSNPGSAACSGRFEEICQAYEEYCSRVDAGEAVDADAFCGRFPHLQASLARMIGCHRVLVNNPALLANEPCWPKPGHTFLGFQLTRLLGRGRFSRVYHAIAPQLGNREVALKVSTAGGGEAWTQGRIKHPHIVRVDSVHTTAEGFTATCMEYHGSATLEDLLNHLRNSPTLASDAAVIEQIACLGTTATAPQVSGERYVDGVRRLGADLAAALACIHEEGIFHRDLKPSNVLLTRAHGAMLLDFNLSADASSEELRLGGTLPYMAPEQLRATDPEERAERPFLLDARTELFSLGVLLYELLTGKHPFGPLSNNWEQTELRRILLERQRAPLTPVRQLNAAVDRDVAALVERCLAADPAARPQSAAEVYRVLRRRPLRRSLWQFLRRHPWIAAASLVVLITAATFAGVAAHGASLRRSWEEGQSAYKDKRYEDAIGHYRDYLKSHPDEADAWFALGRAYQHWGDSDETKFAQAMDAYQRAGQHQPNGTADACIAYCLYRTKQFNYAKHFMLQAEKQGYQSAEFSNDLGYMCINDGDYDAALTHLDKALKENRRLQAAYHNKAIVYLNKALRNGGHRPPGSNPGAQEAAKQNREWVAEAKQNIAAALDCGSPRVELLRDAAQVYAASAIHAPDDCPEVVKLLDRAAREGLDPATFKDNLLLFNAYRWQGLSATSLTRMKALNDVFAQAGHGKVLPPTVRLVDPVRD